MKYREILEKKIEELRDKIAESNDAEEVRSLGETLKAVTDELKALDDVDDEHRQNVPEGAQLRNAQVVGSFGTPAASEENLEYRQAFMEYVLRGTPIPAELRAGENTMTTDVGSVIPTQLVNRIIERMDNIGMIFPLVTKTSYKGGITIPTSSVKPVATWVGVPGNLAGESLGSERQKKTTGSITFAYHKLRCEISMSMEVSVMALSVFEAKFIENVSKAMTYAIEEAIVNGDGTNCPKGILSETPLEGQALTVKGGVITFADLCAWEAAIPEEYEGSAKWCMSKKTFMSIMSITDDSGQPVARVNYGLGGKLERTILGREVVVASKYMPNLAAATANKFAFAFDFSDYIFNTIYDMGISKKQDWDTEDLLTKAVMSADGKVSVVDSLVTISNTLAG